MLRTLNKWHFGSSQPRSCFLLVFFLFFFKSQLAENMGNLSHITAEDVARLRQETATHNAMLHTLPLNKIYFKHATDKTKEK